MLDGTFAAVLAGVSEAAVVEAAICEVLSVVALLSVDTVELALNSEEEVVIVATVEEEEEDADDVPPAPPPPMIALKTSAASSTSSSDAVPNGGRFAHAVVHAGNHSVQNKSKWRHLSQALRDAQSSPH